MTNNIEELFEAGDFSETDILRRKDIAEKANTLLRDFLAKQKKVYGRPLPPEAIRAVETWATEKDFGCSDTHVGILVGVRELK